MKGPLNVNDNV